MTLQLHDTCPNERGTSRVRRVISVCEERDVEVWSAASERIIRNIDAESYQIICPERQVGCFISASAPGWEVVAENRHGGDEFLEQIGRSVRGENMGRVHWLYQQFLKINAIRNSEFEDRDVMVIWDADTIPLRCLKFVENTTGRLLYYHGREYHRPYFRTIRQLLGYDSQASASFIAQCLPVRVGWIRNMMEDIESRFGVPYVEAILGLLPGCSGSEFSEYETIGAWICRHHPDEIVMRERNLWLRSGSSLFGRRFCKWNPHLFFWVLARRYDFVAIENWKRPMSMERIKRCLSRLLYPRE